MSLVENLAQAISDIMIVERNQDEYKKALEKSQLQLVSTNQKLSKRMEEIKTFQLRFTNDTKLKRSWLEELTTAYNTLKSKSTKEDKDLAHTLIESVIAEMESNFEGGDIKDEKENPCDAGK